MDRINQIYNDPLYRREADALAEDEKDRIFCNHGVDHLLEVARLCYLYWLELSLKHRQCEDSKEDLKEADTGSISRELIYAAALLHDIGRHQQYASGEPHHRAGARIAREIMSRVGFNEIEINLIADAIEGHRDDSEREESNMLASLLRRADKKSRSCFACSVRGQCKWPKEKMNMRIEL